MITELHSMQAFAGCILLLVMPAPHKHIAIAGLIAMIVMTHFSVL